VKLLKTLLASILMFMLVFVFTQCETPSKVSTADLKTNQDSVSYILGVQMGQFLEQAQDEINLELVIRTIRAQVAGDSMQLSQADAQNIMRDFNMRMRQKQQEERNEAGRANLQEGEEFLQENKNKEGVITTESGLQYKVLEEGDGPKPSATDKVTVHYRGTTIDGNEFDSSYARGEPATFQVNGVIKGWTEALQLMSVGSKYKLFVPANLAYGERGTRNIEPNSVLIFEVELLGIE
jgi:FKBP-type peptidyl-prolyl cis-trans isomerase